MNADFFTPVRQWFSRVKIIVKSPHEWQTSLFAVTHISLYFCTIFYAFIEHKNPLKQSLIAHFAIFTKYGLFWLGIVASPQFNPWRLAKTQDTGIGTWSYSSFVVACANWRKGDHQWITILNIEFPPPGVHGLACKKYTSFDAVQFKLIIFMIPTLSSRVAAKSWHYAVNLVWNVF